MAVSVSQAACNALASWLRSALTRDIVVQPRWYEANVKLPPKAVTIVKVGRRQRLDVTQMGVASKTNTSSTSARITWQSGAIVQPVQLDVWATSDVARDDIIAQLDDALMAGPGLTGAATSSNPVTDYLLVPMLAADGFSGNVDFWFDEPEFPDTPESVQRAEYRATYIGEARCPRTVVTTSPRLISATLKVKAHEGDTAPPGMLYDTVTLSPNPAPPPAVKLTRGTST